MGTKLEFIRIDPSSTVKVVSLTVGILLAIVLLITFVAAAVGSLALSNTTLNLVAGINWVIAIVPFMYLFVVYAVVFIFCLAFNYACRLFGGIRIEFSDS